MKEKNIQVVHWEGNNHAALIKAKGTHSPDREVNKDPTDKTQLYPNLMQDQSSVLLSAVGQTSSSCGHEITIKVPLGVTALGSRGGAHKTRKCI